jgi:hypothetical protein
VLQSPHVASELKHIVAIRSAASCRPMTSATIPSLRGKGLVIGSTENGLKPARKARSQRTTPALEMPSPTKLYSPDGAKVPPWQIVVLESASGGRRFDIDCLGESSTLDAAEAI